MFWVGPIFWLALILLAWFFGARPSRQDRRDLANIRRRERDARNARIPD